MLAFIADQLRIDSNDFGDYARQRWATRREHLGELQAYLGLQPFGRPDYQTMARIAFNESIGTIVVRLSLAPWWPIYSRILFCALRLPRSKRSLWRRGRALESRPIRS